jgi:thiamine-phosphate pyrophosphorylase
VATHETARITRAHRTALLRGIYLIVNDSARAVAIASAALGAGVRIVQYRAKSGIDAERLRALREITRAHDALLIMNDDCEATLAFDCDGVHLGPDDAGFTRVDEVRTRVEDRLIGLSCGTVDEARQAGDADYLGVGSVFATASKADAGAPIGIDGLRAVAAATALPVAAIGGITPLGLALVRHTGVAMAAVISAIGDHPYPATAARELIAIWDAR